MHTSVVGIRLRGESMRLTKDDAVELMREVGKVFDRDFSLGSGVDPDDWDREILHGVIIYNVLILKGEYETLDLAYEKALQHIRDQVQQKPSYPRVRKRITLGIYKLFRKLENELEQGNSTKEL